MGKVVVTGGTGYIGSHTIVDLLEHDFEVVSIDNCSRSEPQIIDRIEEITGQKIINHQIDLCDLAATKKVFDSLDNVIGVIHFAAFKTVPESVEKPLLYFHNNLVSLINVLKCIEQNDIPNFVFSSSCSVYGNVEQLPVTEKTPFGKAECPYARTKQMGEEMIRDFAVANPHSTNILLRYFNPVGAHDSALIGELQRANPNNLVPVITQTAAGIIEQMKVFGKDYDTRDGTCIRDYIHVMDIANAHTKALQYSIDGKNKTNCEVFNLGTGKGVTVLEAINSFEKVSREKLNYIMTDRRPGDIEAIYANNDYAKQELGWSPDRDINIMMDTAWRWELGLKERPI